MTTKRYHSFSRYGVILGAMLVLCMAWTCSATLNPAFDMKNQNGMPSTYYTCGDTINFTDKTTSPDGDRILAYNWTILSPTSGVIGGPSSAIICSSSLPAGDFSFPVPCPDSYPTEYIARLEVISNQSWITYTTNVTFTVDDYSEYIRANFSHSVDYEKTPANVTFFDLSEAQNLALITDWYWTIDGVQMGDSKSPIVSRELNAGTYRVNLTVRDKTGDIASISKNVIVSTVRATYTPTPTPTPAPLSADFSASPTSGQAPLQVQFFDLSAGSPVAWNWDFGDGGSSTQKSPIHNYLRPGIYTVDLTVFDSSLSTSSVSKAGLIDIDSYYVKN